jgi:hypothetical protein
MCPYNTDNLTDGTVARGEEIAHGCDGCSHVR